MSNEKELQARQKSQDGAEPSALTEQVDQPQRADDDSRRRFVFKLGLFGATAAVVYAKPNVTYARSCSQLSPVGVTSQDWTGTGSMAAGTCTALYSYTGSIEFEVSGGQITINSLVYNGTFTGGPPSFGSITLQNNGQIVSSIDGNGNFNIDGAQLNYSDTLFNLIPVPFTVTMSGGVALGCLSSLSITSTGTGVAPPGCVLPFGDDDSLTNTVEKK